MKQSKHFQDCDKAMKDWQEWAENQQILNPEEFPPLHFTPKDQKNKSAFKLFKLDHIVEIKKQHPEYGFKERLETLKHMWRNLNKDEKYIYVQKSKQLKF
ncbi:unnamed protein product [Paramecium sonneborni]|uniref:HMG box domain-containing protein n=1 Tax=Paramecium sonneborni TaxID=65129 RepID=A0A8S1QTH2_9CILI|nr:unnamed protein product [Paramecium sonneborni]